MDEIQKKILHEVAELDSLPVGAYNIRANGVSAARNSTANIEIVTKTDRSGIDIIIKPNTKNESVHIPVVISETGLKECVYNDFFIGEDCDVVIVAPVKIALSSYDVSLSSLGVTEVARVRPKPSNGKYRVKVPAGEYSVLPVVDGMVIAAGLARNGQGYANYVDLSANEIKTFNITVKYLVY